ncbi:ead/Ea22-like family protein [Pseudomonas aeruginosa]|nr:ead/Ea22-like family protein [Pseudomonas aeruginosa]
MTDHAELRRVAKAATPGPWSCNRHWAIVGGPTLEFTNGAAQQQIAMACWQSWMHEEELRNNAEFIAANNPKTVLALLDEIDRLKAENCAHKDTQKHCECLEQYLKECASALPGTYYMDPPDGGDVSIPEQIRRMAKDAARYRWLRERDLETISRGGVFAGMTPENIVLNQEDLDAEIDAALEGATQ